MKKLTLIGIASACAAVALVWSVPASAAMDVFSAHDKKPEHMGVYKRQSPTITPVPEPGTLALLALGLGGLGIAPLRRRRTKP